MHGRAARTLRQLACSAGAPPVCCVACGAPWQRLLARSGHLGLLPPSAALPPWQAGAYRRLQSVTARLASAAELAALLPCVTTEALPELRTLCLAAEGGGGGVRGALGALRHPGLRRLVLHGVEAEGGFEGFQHLEGGFRSFLLLLYLPWAWELRCAAAAAGAEQEGADGAQTIRGGRREPGGSVRQPPHAPVPAASSSRCKPRS